MGVLLFWFFSDFRCGVSLFIVILVISKYKNRTVPRGLFCFGSLVILDVVCRFLSLFLLYLNIKIDVYYYDSRWAPVWEIAVHLAVAGDAFDGEILCCPFSHEMSWMRSRT